MEPVEERKLHYLMSAAGGYIGVYSILGRNGIFALAQTMNLIQTVISVEEGDFSEAALRLGAVGLFGLAVGISAFLLKQGDHRRKKLSIAVTALVILAEGVISPEAPSMAALYPVFFAMTLQWCAFSGAGVYGSSTIFSTNNLRQCVDSYVRHFFGREQGMLEKARFFRNTLISYHIGVAVCFAAMRVMDNRCIWLCLPLLAAAWRHVQGGRLYQV